VFATSWQLLRPALDVDTEAPCGTSVAERRGALALLARALNGKEQPDDSGDR
jgi:hypothetical protein